MAQYRKRKTPEIKPLKGIAIINPIPLEEKSEGGIILLDNKAHPSKLQKGVVVANGRPLKDLPVQVKKNDMVLFGRGAGSKLVLDGVEYRILRHNEIISIL